MLSSSRKKQRRLRDMELQVSQELPDPDDGEPGELSHRLRLSPRGGSEVSSDDDWLRRSSVMGRRVRLPHNIFGLAIAASVDETFVVTQRVMINIFLVASCLIQGFLIHMLREISDEALGPKVCECSYMLQWSCVFLYLMIMWDEVSSSFELLEFVLFSGEADPLPDSQGFLGQVGPADQWQVCVEGEMKSHRTPMYAPVHLSHEEVDWQFMSAACTICPEEAAMDVSFEDGFNVKNVRRCTRVAFLLFAVLPKLALELAMLWIGAQYVAVSKSNEEVINSVVAVTFIISIDELILTSLISGRIRHALERTEVLTYNPSSMCAVLWTRIRTTWKIFIDPFLIVVLTQLILSRAYHHAGCYS
ncbi:unnamed protein product [Polarella glacialis]|uniref:Uncharacterized protein n=1 Tax=Polarella glacialis TaxID=89957 RepID=A0A813JRP3_POLGL|nr:unnamed protein product [Polarella glacialis]